tara:strand:+ start:1961 stop:2800 length:840 start_codon:yes stop_codon:yes gene_type:complete
MDTKKKINVTILGSTGKIGLYLANKYLEEGHNLNLFYRKEKNKILIKRKLKNLNYKNKIKLLKFNSSSENNLIKCIKKNKKVFKKTDLLVITIAEQGEINNFFKINSKSFNKSFYINFLFYVIFFRIFFKILNKNKKLLVILFSGGGSTSFRENFSTYSLSKVCLVKLTEIMSKEIHSKKVRFNILSPGIIYSKMTKQILKNKNKVSKYELIKINRNIKYSEINLNNIFTTINFLNSRKGEKITGKLISSAWDKINKINSKIIYKLVNSNMYTLIRKEF